jgi:hypothetical protein
VATHEYSTSFGKCATLIIIFSLFNIRKYEEGIYKPYEKNRIRFIPNSFGVDKNM